MDEWGVGGGEMDWSDTRMKRKYEPYWMYGDKWLCFVLHRDVVLLSWTQTTADLPTKCRPKGVSKYVPIPCDFVSIVGADIRLLQICFLLLI